MKFAKLSLAAIMAMGVSAFAADVKVDGDVKVYYGTTDADGADGITRVSATSGDMFSQNNSYGDAAIRLGMTAEDMPGGLTARISTTYLTTLGLEGRLVNGIWAGSATTSANTPFDGMWFDEMYVKGTAFDKTTIIAGRQYLDTPMVFSEKWNIAANSYDAAVVVDQHLEKTALVAAWVWRSNVNGGLTVSNGNGSFNDGFSVFGDNGAFAFGAVTGLIPMTTAQAWYFNVDSVADAYWLQADVTPELDNDLKVTLGVQFAGTMASTAVVANPEDATFWGVKAGVELENGLALNAAYSSVDKGDIGFANVGGAQSKMYTEAWWNYGYVSATDTDAYMVSAEYSMEDVANFGAYYTSSSNDTTDVDMTEFALTAGKTFGAFDTSVAYIYTDADDLNGGDSFNNIQVYLTYNF